MRKFRFIGDSSGFKWDILPMTGAYYTINELDKMSGFNVMKWHLSHFEEVFDDESQLTIENHIAQIVHFAKSKGMTVEIIFKSGEK